MITIVLTALISAVVAIIVWNLITTYITKNTIKKQREVALKEAEAEGEMIKKEKILQAKEKFIQLKSEHDRQINERNQKIAQSEQRAKQIEANLVNQQRDLDNKIKENDRIKEQMAGQMQSLNSKKEELAGIIKEQNVRLEQISGMSAEEAKNILIENMKAEAKAEADSYINETIIRALADGVVTEIFPEEGELVGSGAPIMNVAKADGAYLTFNIREDLLKDFEIGKSVNVYIPAKDTTINATVSGMKNVGSYAVWKSTKALGQYDLKTFEVKMRPEAQNLQLAAGMSAIIK